MMTSQTAVGLAKSPSTYPFGMPRLIRFRGMMTENQAR
jgi:hypothetical protein